MAYRQYIGARYVVRFDGSWDATKNYEPLVVVDDANGNSFTSKKDVPAGTPLTDRTYWQQTSSFSGAVERLRRDVSGLQGDVSGLQGDVSGLQDDVTAIGQRIDKLSNRKFLFVCDSYGLYYTDDNKTIAQVFTEKTGLPADQVQQTSIGFSTANENYQSLVQTYAGDVNKITDIVIVGGANDIKNDMQQYDSILSGAQSFVARAKAMFPNLKNIVMCACGVSFYGILGTTFAADRYLTFAYSSALPIAGIGIIPNSFYILRNTLFLRADKVHPNGDGIVRIADCINAWVHGSVMENNFIFKPIISPETGVSNAFPYLMMQRRNGVVEFLASPEASFGSWFFVAGSFTVTNGSQATRVKVATYERTLIDFTGHPICIPVRAWTGTEYVEGLAEFEITNGSIYVRLFGFASTASYTFTQVVGFVPNTVFIG